MVTSETLNLTGKLTWKPSPKFKITYDLVLDDGERFSRSNFRRYRFNPDGRPKTFTNATNHSIGITHTLSNKMFYTLKFGVGFTNARTYVFEDPFDPRYVPSFEGLITNNLIQPTDYLAGGTDLNRSRSETRSLLAKVDVINQIHPAHELKFGAEFQHHRLETESFTLLYKIGDEKPTIPRIEDKPEFTSPQNYIREPIQAAVYFLDKIELARSFILNIGGRYEYLSTRALYNPDLAGTVDVGVAKAENLKQSQPKHRFAPRASLSFPITERGIIRFSYGHFYQNPTFSQIYRNSRFEDFDFNLVPSFGNANLEPQRSIQYEMGLQQQFSDDFKADLTVFYKDVSNLIQSRRVYAGEIGATKDFNVITNISYANIKGFTVAFLKRKSPGGILSATLDYTFEVAEGAFDNPLKLAIDTRSGRDTEQKFVPLDHDRTHTLNATLTLSKSNNWSLSAIGSAWTGTPYTPSLPFTVQDVEFETNSARRPLNTNLDMKLEKYFKYSGFRFSIFVQIENALDTINERFVHTNTGSSLTSLDESTRPTLFNNLKRRINNEPENFFPIKFIDNFYQREDWLAPPREIRWGMTFSF
ncbi:MAG: TonB-dependent receptor plug domain-containing protein, partial [bacterium]